MADIQELQLSIDSDDVEEVTSLLSRLEDHCDVSGQFGGLLLLRAVQHHSVRCVNLFLDRGFQVNYWDSRGETPLLSAIEQGDYALVQRLITRGADVNLQTAPDRHPVVRAASNTRSGVQILQHLLGAGGHVTPQNDQSPAPLCAAVVFSNIEKVKCLLDAGAQVNQRHFSGYSVLELAMLRGFFDIAELLLKRGANVGENCLLSLQAYSPDADFLEALILAGAKVNVSNIAGDSPLTASVNNADLSAVKVLLDYGAKVGMDLHIAASEGQTEIVKELVRHGAMPMLKLPVEGDEEITPFTAAAAADQFDILEYFLNLWFLHETDVKYVVHSREIRENLQIYEHAKDLEASLSKPLSLACLSFVVVSNAVGFEECREERVKRLVLPRVLQNRLLFKDEQPTSYRRHYKRLY